MANKVTFGLENVYVAFKGVAQVESITVTNECTLDGEITVTITGAPLTGGSEAVVVPLSTESHGTEAAVASAIANTLNLNADFAANYIARVIGAVVYVVARVVATNDATLDIAVSAGSTGVTVGSSTVVSAGATGWGTPTAIPGAVRWTPTAQGEENKFYADNGLYYIGRTNNGYTGELEMALVPISVLATMLGYTLDANGALVEDADAEPAHFALLFQVQGDDKNRRIVYYDCVASRPNQESSTKGESLEVATDTLAITVMPIEIGSTNVVKSVLELSDSNATAYNAFFSSVYQPA